jgi:RNA polymerase sigma-70 factor (ECF subfamily)
MTEENYLLEELKNGNKLAFSILFRKYYVDLVLFAGNKIYDKTRCEDIVQNIFLKIWSERETFHIESSFKSFLLKSVKNACLDEIRHLQVIRAHEAYSESVFEIDQMNDTENYVLFSDLNVHLNEAIAKLPDTYREAFELNRINGLKYREIAEKLHVSERTIEVRIGKALNLLRNYLKEYLVTVFLIYFMNLFQL